MPVTARRFQISFSERPYILRKYKLKKRQAITRSRLSTNCWRSWLGSAKAIMATARKMVEMLYHISLTETHFRPV
jgi:hypothetical protein